MTDPRDIEAILEAILFVANEPVSRQRLLEVFDEKERTAAQAALESVLERYRETPDRGILIDEVAGGLRLVSRPDLHGYLRRFFEVSGANKLTMAALETLAIIAYRQPVTGPEIQELRGVNSSGVIKKLLERRLVRIAGRKEVVGKPFIYSTTREFLMHFGLRSLKELPPLEQFEDLFGGELDTAEEVSEPDLEEQIQLEVASVGEADDEAAESAELEAIEKERASAAVEEEEAELNELAEAQGLGAEDSEADGVAEEEETLSSDETAEGDEDLEEREDETSVTAEEEADG